MRSPLTLSLLVIAAFGAAPPASAGPPVCPPGHRPTPRGCKATQPSVRAVPRGAERTPSRERAGELLAAPETDLRPDAPLVQRSRKLLLEEIAGLESLLARTPRKAPDRARLVLRLAGDYAELGALSERAVIRHEIEMEDARRALEAGATPAPVSPKAQQQPGRD